jgi:hypothetical protein
MEAPKFTIPRLTGPLRPGQAIANRLSRTAQVDWSVQKNKHLEWNPPQQAGCDQSEFVLPRRQFYFPNDEALRRQCRAAARMLVSGEPVLFRHAPVSQLVSAFRKQAGPQRPDTVAW